MASDKRKFEYLNPGKVEITGRCWGEGRLKRWRGEVNVDVSYWELLHDLNNPQRERKVDLG